MLQQVHEQPSVVAVGTSSRCRVPASAAPGTRAGDLHRQELRHRGMVDADGWTGACGWPKAICRPGTMATSCSKGSTSTTTGASTVAPRNIVCTFDVTANCEGECSGNAGDLLGPNVRGDLPSASIHLSAEPDESADLRGATPVAELRSRPRRPPLPSGPERGPRLFLKSLTLKGFKSFADKTTLEFEPGVCVVVGPNGSGKSNIVDSVAWVLGAQGARALRGGKMDDVIFAGTADRPALGRAEVSLTIDNTAHLLPIEFSEVTITRMLFRTGESEYMINGAPCRLLDIQELLSDTGIGRQQHVIVGQGQLDAVLNARPEDRRAIIEEAAGILKFRKRKEKARAPARSDRRQPAAPHRPAARSAPSAAAARTAGRRRAPSRRPRRRARTRSVCTSRVARSISCARAQERAPSSAPSSRQKNKTCGCTLRALDAEVLDAEHALAIPGDDDVADVLAAHRGVARARPRAREPRRRTPARSRARARRGRRRRRRRVAGRRSRAAARAARRRRRRLRRARRRRGPRSHAAEARLRRPVGARRRSRSPKPTPRRRGRDARNGWSRRRRSGRARPRATARAATRRRGAASATR